MKHAKTIENIMNRNVFDLENEIGFTCETELKKNINFSKNESCKNHRKYNEQKIQNVFDVENGMVLLVRQN